MTAPAAEAPARGGLRPAPGGRIWSESSIGLSLISPTFLFAILFLLAPALVVVAHSFWTQDYLTIDTTFTLENYRQALTQPIYLDLLGRSMLIAFTVSILTVLLAYPIAYFISFHGGRHKNIWLLLITIPFWSSYLLRVMAWKVILGYQGVLNTGLISLGVIQEPLEGLLYNANAVVLTMTHAWAVFAILPIFVSLEKIDRSLLEAATDLGDGPVRRFLRITLPLSMTGIVSAILIVMIPTVGDYVTPAMVGGSEGVMIANAIQAQFGKASNWPLGSALTVTTMVVVGLMAGAVVLAANLIKRVVR